MWGIVCKYFGHSWYHERDGFGWEDIDWTCFWCGVQKEGNYN